jgi:hypothetical protein
MAKKKLELKLLKKGDRCPKGWTTLQIKVGSRSRRACVHGKAERVKSGWEKAFDNLFYASLILH